MKLRLLAIVFFVAALPIFGVNVSGKWTFTRQAARGGRGPAPMVVTLNQVGSELSGSVTPPPGNSTGSPANVEVLGGKIEGDTVSFYIWTGLDKPVRNFYSGKLNGEEILFTVTVDNAPAPFQVVAKRAR
jgi:hypothetical protein